ncbi:hypothetical protein JDV02_005549 [Purpureocillium takamizusanense]|uniref:Peptidase A1 domain-containing protein n=1 Tax=Purpureocillium takamizusanense TaxID=2060973 RepID=A0A9Q8QGQ3_9HYPO|nr:uncharacterized protein JDV02_005549 [Purpureocillium takamizusanense]UNI19363.1 hypothetical protein JDV02_005549 [Purpureocillium takamizusanense]
MLSSLLFAAATATATATASLGALALSPQTGSNAAAVDEHPGILSFPVTATTKYSVTNGGSSATEKRQTAVDIISQNQGTFYTIDLVLGTPGQKVTVVFDTGSAELWVNPNCAKSYDPTLCSKFGRFTGSQTLVDAHANGEIRYGTGVVELAYVYDYVQLGPAKLSQQIFGVALDSNFTVTGIMGAGPMGATWNSSYPLVVDSLAQQGFISSRAFSLDLRKIGDARGSVTFGGVDTKKFSGTLEKRPIIPGKETPDRTIRYWVYLDGMAVTYSNNTFRSVFRKVNGVPVFLDSGGTLCQLPTSVIKELLRSFPSAKKNGKVYTVDCPAADSDWTVDFYFGKTVVRAPVNDFIWRSGKYCILGAYENDKEAILGDTFLRAAYVVYDQDNQNIHIANNEDCGSNLIPIGKGPDAVPSVTGDTTTSWRSGTVSSTSITRSSNFTALGNYTWTVPTRTPTGTGSSATTTTTTSSLPTVTSTVKTTRTYTITSCAPTVTNCDIGKVVTEVSTFYTTYCPSSTSTSTSTSSTSSTSIQTSRATNITTGTARASVPNSMSTTPVYTLPYRYTCRYGPKPCPSETRPPAPVVTMHSVVTQSTTVKVPGCASCSGTSLISSSSSSSSYSISGFGGASSGVNTTTSATLPSFPPQASATAGKPVSSSRSEPILGSPTTPCGSTCSSTLQAPPTATGAGGRRFDAPGSAALAVVGVAAFAFW